MFADSLTTATQTLANAGILGATTVIAGVAFVLAARLLLLEKDHRITDQKQSLLDFFQLTNSINATLDKVREDYRERRK